MLLNQMIQFRLLLLRLKKKKKKRKKEKPVLWDLANTSLSSLPDPVSCTVPEWIDSSKPHSSWIFVLAANQELAPAVLAPNFFNSFLFFILVLRVRAKEIHLQVFTEHQSLRTAVNKAGEVPAHRSHILKDGEHHGTLITARRVT